MIKRPWPAMIRTIWGDPERYKKSYYPEDFHGKYYLAGDGASRDAERLLPDHGPHRRRAERLRASPGHHGNRIGSGGQPAGGRGRGRRAAATRSTGEAVCAFMVLKGRARPAPMPHKMLAGTARLGRQGNRPDRQTRRHPLRRQPAQDALGQDHAPPAALHRQGRGDHAGRLHSGESGHPGSTQGSHSLIV